MVCKSNITFDKESPISPHQVSSSSFGMSHNLGDVGEPLSVQHATQCPINVYRLWMVEPAVND